MSFKLRTLATATLAIALGAGLVTQVAIAQPAFATDPTATATTAADATATTTADDAAEAQAAADGATAGTADASAASDADAGAGGSNSEANSAAEAAAAADSTAKANANGNGAAAGETGVGPDPQQPGTTTPVEPVEPVDPEKSGAKATNAKAKPTEIDPDEAALLGDRIKAADALFGAAPLAKGFKAGYIISDANFYDENAMSESEIQAFLDARLRATKDGRCTIGDTGRKAGAKYGSTKIAQNCMKDARFNTNYRTANAYCKALPAGTQESAARIIAKVSKACGISARVLLITLEKEQSLVTDTWPTVQQYDRATGYACPDSGPGGTAKCDPAYAGFSTQIYYSGWQIQMYKAKSTTYRYKPFQTNTIQYHPNINCGTSQVYIANYATAALYIYTPYRPNPAALNAGWGTGDSCSSYGNRNFFQFYNAWFGSPTSYFPDVVENHKFFKEIEWMGTSGLSTGVKVNDGRGALYMPKAQVTREAMAAFLYRLERANYKGPATSPFSDLKPGDKFYNEITWMYETKLSTGIKQPSGKPKYAPKDNVSREAMAAFIYRLQDANYAAPKPSPFSDMKQGDKFYREISWMYAEKLSTGIKQPSGKPKYAPKDRVSREAMAAFIYRMEH